MGGDNMLVAKASFEFLPVKIGGLGEAVTSIATYLQRSGDDVWMFMPSHGIQHMPEAYPLRFRKFLSYETQIGGKWQNIDVWEGWRDGVRVFALSDPVMDNPEVYGPTDEDVVEKIFHFSAALPGLMNYLVAHEGRKPAVFHIHDWHTTLAGALIKKYFRIPVVLTINRICYGSTTVAKIYEMGYGEFVDGKWLYGEGFDLEKFGAYSSDFLTTVSYSYLQEEWDRYFHLFDGKVTYVWNGADTEYWNLDNIKWNNKSREERRNIVLHDIGLNDGIMYLFVGRFDRAQKGLDILADSIRMVLDGSRDNPNRSELRFIIGGDGDAGLKELVYELSSVYPDNVYYFGRFLSREEVRELYGAADFVIVPSKFEPFGLVALEAMAMEAVPIASRVGGLKDIILDIVAYGDRGTGKLVPPSDAGALADAIISMANMAISTPKFLRLIGRNGREHVVSHFTWDKAIKRYKRIYSDMFATYIPFVKYKRPL